MSRQLKTVELFTIQITSLQGTESQLMSALTLQALRSMPWLYLERYRTLAAFISKKLTLYSIVRKTPGLASRPC